MKVIYDGVEHEVGEPDNLDLVRFERQFKISAASLGDSARIEHMLFLVHSRLVRLGLTAAKWSDDEIVKLQLVGGEEESEAEVDPTEVQEKQPAA